VASLFLKAAFAAYFIYGGKKMKYRLIQVADWDLTPENRGFISLSAREKAVWFFLLTNRHTHISGLYLISLGLIADHFPDLKPENIRKIMKKLAALKMILYDEKRGLLLIPGYWASQAQKLNAKIRSAVAQQLRQFQAHPWVYKFLALYPQFQDTLSDTLSDDLADE